MNQKSEIKKFPKCPIGGLWLTCKTFEKWRVQTKNTVHKQIAEAEQDKFILKGDLKAEKFLEGYIKAKKEFLEALE